MSLINDPVLGRVVDELEPDYQQEKLNAFSLYEYDVRQFIISLDDSLSIYDLNYYFDVISDDDKDAWVAILETLMRIYGLYELRKIKEDFDIMPEFVPKIKKMIKYLKIDMIKFMFNGDINKDMSLSELQDFLKEKDTPDMLWHCVMYNSREFNNVFLNTIYNEVFPNF